MRDKTCAPGVEPVYVLQAGPFLIAWRCWLRELHVFVGRYGICLSLWNAQRLGPWALSRADRKRLQI